MSASRLHHEARKLPEVGFGDHLSAPLGEQLRPALERRPVRPDRWTGTQVRTSELQNLPKRQLLRNEDPLARIVNHEDRATEHSGRYLKRGRVLSRNKPARLVDVELRAGPPAGEGMTHQENTELVDPLGDLVRHDPQLRL